MLVARAVLDRYPALRTTWPVRQAHAWRERRAWRQHPRRMAAWFRDAPDMHTRVCVSNLELPDAAELCRPTDVQISLLDADGQPLAARRGQFPSGQVRIDFEGPQLGSSRAYLHWYNDRSLTSSHEKFGLSIPAVGGYWTVPNVQDSDDYRVHLAVTNLDDRPYLSEVILKDAGGESLSATVAVPPNGSRFAALPDLFDSPAAFLANRPGILYFGNNHQPAMYYYFVLNGRLGTWRA